MNTNSLADRVKAPALKVGTKLIWSYLDENNNAKSANAVIISNNTIDYETLTALYDIELDVVNEKGKKIIIEGVPEEIFLIKDVK